MRHSDSAIEVIGFEPLPGLVESRLQAHSCHYAPPGVRTAVTAVSCNLLRPEKKQCVSGRSNTPSCVKLEAL